MKVLLVGSGGVGGAIAAIAARRSFVELLVVADVDPARARGVAAGVAEGGMRCEAVCLDASSADAIVEVARTFKVDAIVNACDPRFNPPIFEAAFRYGATYLDMAMNLSTPHPNQPYELVGQTLGAGQDAMHEQWVARRQLALVGMGVEPGLSDVFARYANDHLFSRIDEIGVRDGGNLVIEGYDFAPTFSIWTTIEECLNPPIIYERDRGWFTTAPFSEPEQFMFPEGIGTIECVNVEHEEVLLIPRVIDVGRVTFKYGLGEDFIDMLEEAHRQNVLEALSAAMAGDRARCRVTGLSPLGLVEMSRKRTRESLQRQLCDPCPTCEGRGFVRSVETVCQDIFREVLRQGRQSQGREILILAHQDVLDRLLAEDSAAVRELQAAVGPRLRLQVETLYAPDQFDLVVH